MLNRTHVAVKTPLKKRYPKINIMTLARSSPQTMAMYGLRRGFLLRLVCLMASQTVKKPKPREKPTAMAPTVSSFPSSRLLMLAMGVPFAEVRNRTRERHSSRWSSHEGKCCSVYACPFQKMRGSRIPFDNRKQESRTFKLLLVERAETAG